MAQQLGGQDPGLARRLSGPVPDRRTRQLLVWVLIAGIAAGVAVAAPIAAVPWLLGAGLALLALAGAGLAAAALIRRRVR